MNFMENYAKQEKQLKKAFTRAFLSAQASAVSCLDLPELTLDKIAHDSL